MSFPDVVTVLRSSFHHDDTKTKPGMTLLRVIEDKHKSFQHASFRVLPEEGASQERYPNVIHRSCLKLHVFIHRLNLFDYRLRSCPKKDKAMLPITFLLCTTLVTSLFPLKYPQKLNTLGANLSRELEPKKRTTPFHHSPSPPPF